MSNRPLVLAINLPQYHPFKENNEWWGEGFTEWTNVVEAKPLFKGHYQPHLPADLGFYDLRLPESRQAQADMAKKHNIDGFCYYHYWFSGKRLMREPIDAILESKQPDFPFCFFWANENWSRRWLGDDQEILIEQKYSEEDDYEHAKWLVNAFKDSRYIKINSRPVFLCYKPLDLPNPKKTKAIFKEVCHEHGLLEPFFIASNSHNLDINAKDLGFDFNLNFQTRHAVLTDFMKDGPSLKKAIRNFSKGVFNASLKLYTYKEYKDRIRNLNFPHPGFPCVNVGFDNTARRGNKAIILHGQSTDIFKKSLIDAKKNALALPDGQQIVFINAWNEWAEGNHLEPDLKEGLAYLEIVKEVFST